MIDKITVLGELLTSEINGIIIGGKQFRKGLIIEAQVDEETYQKLLIAVENKWFSIKKDNYQDWLISRGRSPLSYAKAKVEVVASKAFAVPVPEVIEVVENKTPEAAEPAEVKVEEIQEIQEIQEVKEEEKVQSRKRLATAK